MSVQPGLSVLLDRRPDLIVGKRVGLVCNASSVTPDLRHAADRLQAAPGVHLARLFGPEHGLRGDAQDMIPVDGEPRDARTGLPVVTLYGPQEASLWPREAALSDLDVIVFDIQDVGARYYTYVYTMAHVMEVAGRVGVPVVVCDRPNPIRGDLVEGNVVRPGFESFVGRYPLANRHGMTAGELAGFFTGECGLRCDFEVVRADGWQRAMPFEATGLPWVQPSPNMPTVDTAFVYPGQCFFEGTLLSEGRGCTRPFEVVGAPFVDGDAWAEHTTAALRDAGSDGCVLRPLTFRPTFHKHGGLPCGGVQIHVTDRDRYEPVLVAAGLLRAAWALWPDQARWRTERYEFVESPIAIDLLAGDDVLRREVEQGAPLAAIRARWADECADFRAKRARYLLYP